MKKHICLVLNCLCRCAGGVGGWALWWLWTALYAEYGAARNHDGSYVFDISNPSIGEYVSQASIAIGIMSIVIYWLAFLLVKYARKDKNRDSFS